MIFEFALLAVIGISDSTINPSVSPEAQAPDSLHRRSIFEDARIGLAGAPVDDSVRPRARAIQISDSYGWKFRTHRLGGYAIVPLFLTQYALGSELLRQKEDVFEGRRTESVSKTLRGAHLATAIGVGTVFLANTVTGAMLLYENRGDPHRRNLKVAHTILMLAADAGFAATGVMGRRALEETPPYARRHRRVALGSIGVATAGAAMMWIFNR